MHKLSIRGRIVGSFTLVLFAMFGMGLFAELRLRVINMEAVAVRDDSVPGLQVSLRLVVAWTERLALLDERVLADTPHQLEQANEHLRANRASIQRLSTVYAATVLDTAERALADQLQQQKQLYSRIEADVLSAEREQNNNEARRLMQTQLRPAYDQLQLTLHNIADFNKVTTDSSTLRIGEEVVSAQIGIAVSLAVAALIAVVCGYLLLRAITGPLGLLVRLTEAMRLGDFSNRAQGLRQDEFGTLGGGFNRMIDDLAALIAQVQRSSIQVSTSITETAATAKEQQATASEIAATTSEIGATSREITATSRELVRTMEEVSHVAEGAASLGGAGQAGLGRMEDTMRQVVTAAGSINAKLAVLNEKAGNISQVVTTITKVADQTNLLSLNAAIEAEKAGEYGRGFAVVATEIRRLADQTAVATYDIEQMVKDIQSAVSAGVMGMDRFSDEVRRGMQEIHDVGGQLAEIIRQVQGLAPRFESVSEGMQAQVVGAGQISDALSQLSEAVSQTVESLQQSSLAVDELNQVAAGLRGSISRFRLA